MEWWNSKSRATNGIPGENQRWVSKSGRASYLKSTRRILPNFWTAVQLPHEPTVHRIYLGETTGKSNYLTCGYLRFNGRGNKGWRCWVKVIGSEKPAWPETVLWKTNPIRSTPCSFDCINIYPASLLELVDGDKAFSLRKRRRQKLFP